ncbi:hypothetical protein [Methylobacterium variabile]|jgi:hypothetical protein|uniref:hypothetical protein n=1 Tax=Methylobacterium variabile TaxID=298794 RepID=UPI000AE79D6A|nr:hypothetical protein [Methylobacterium variabile]
MSSNGAFPIRETITQVSAASYVVARGLFICVYSETILETLVSLAIAFTIEVAAFVVLVAIVVNVVTLHVLAPRIRSTLRALESGQDRVGQRSDTSHAGPA